MAGEVAVCPGMCVLTLLPGLGQTYGQGEGSLYVGPLGSVSMLAMTLDFPLQAVAGAL